MRRTHLTALTVTVLALAACGGRERPRETPVFRPQVLRDVPKYPVATLQDTSGAVDAERETWLVPSPFDSVSAYYRRELPKAGWVVMGDRGDSTMLDLYARKGEATVWVHIVPKQRPYTEFTLIGSAGVGTPGTPVPRDTP